MSCMNAPGLVNMHMDIFINIASSIGFGLSSTRKQIFGSLKTELSEDSFQDLQKTLTCVQETDFFFFGLSIWLCHLLCAMARETLSPKQEWMNDGHKRIALETNQGVKSNRGRLVGKTQVQAECRCENKHQTRILLEKRSNNETHPENPEPGKVQYRINTLIIVRMFAFHLYG